MNRIEPKPPILCVVTQTRKREKSLDERLHSQLKKLRADQYGPVHELVKGPLIVPLFRNAHPKGFEGEVKVVSQCRLLEFEGKIIDGHWVGKLVRYIGDEKETFAGDMIVADLEQFRLGKFQLVYGTSTFTDGKTYSGKLIDRVRTGFGTVRGKDGEIIFEGIFDNDQYKLGVVYEIGVSYFGQFQKYQPHGIGITVFTDGKSYLGKYRNGHFVEGIITHPNGSKTVVSIK